MSYIVELSFDIQKVKNIITFKNAIVKEALKYKCEFFYLNNEIMGNTKGNFKNHYVLTFHIPEEDENMLDFIGVIKSIPDLNIESIGFDNCKFYLMYASRKYLRQMDKFCGKEYIANKKENKLYKQDCAFMKLLHA